MRRRSERGQIWAPTLAGAFALAAERSVPVDALLRDAGWDPRATGGADAWVPAAWATDLFDELGKRLGEPDVGLVAGCIARSPELDLFHYVGISCPTVGAAIDTFAGAFRLVTPDGAADVIRGAGSVKLICRAGDASSRQVNEYLLATILSGFRRITSHALRPQLVEFMHSPPLSRRAHDRVFACGTRFDAEVNAIDFPEVVDTIATLRPDPALLTLLGGLGADMLARLPGAGSAVDAARAVVLRELSSGRVDLALVARKLGITPRTLQRRLAAERVPFAALVDGVRRHLATGYLRTANASVSEVAHTLGYADVQSFRRVFKRWFGVTPSQYARRASDDTKSAMPGDGMGPT